MHLGALGPPLGHWRRTNYVPAPSMLHNNICEVQNITWNATYWVTYLCNFVLVSFNALWHACMLRVCAVACDSGWPAGGRAGQNGDLGHHFPSTPLGSRLGWDLYNTHQVIPGPSIAIYCGYTSSPRAATLSLHQRHGAEHFISGAVEEDPIYRNRRFSSPSWADGACGVRR